jgi:hypothetical protein
LVSANFYHIIFEQDRRVQEQATEGAHPLLRVQENLLTLSQVPIEKYFPEYTGGADINKAAKYILWKFMQANRARLSVYPQ